MSLRVEEFLRRFFLHVLPPGFVRIRHFGLFAIRLRKVSFELCRSLLAEAGATVTAPAAASAATNFWLCPDCGGVVVLIERLTPAQTYVRPSPDCGAAA